MLHEILLSLSGYPSEVWALVKNGDRSSYGIHDYVSEPEQAMLEVLGHISRLHIQIKETAVKLAATHKSVIFRAICSDINATHLAAFRKKVLEVEASILSQHAGYVGGYGIVPLSTIVSEFQPWSRRLEWLDTVIRFAEEPKSKTQCTGKALLDWLHNETRTGYADIEDLATSLLVTSQKVWLQIAASWILYGKPPAFGAGDFFVQRNSKASNALDQFLIEDSLVPAFVSSIAAKSVLAIGNALIHIQSHTRGNGSLQGPGTRLSTLIPKHLQALESLSYPMHVNLLEGVLADIDDSISQNALSQLLPFEDVTRLLHVIQRFLLLGDGEFTVSLIEHAAERIAERQQAQTAARPVRKVGRLDDLIIKEGELSALLRKCWDELAALDLDVEDEDTFAFAREIIMLRSLAKGEEVPLSTLLPTACVLDLQLPPESPLTMFMNRADTHTYSSVNAYLMSVRRTEIQLANLWKLTSQRRCHPTPLGPPRSASRAGQQALQGRRKRETSRAGVMRQHWATTSKALFVLTQLDGYFHGEVIHNSWDHFNMWLLGKRDRPGSSRSQGSRPGTASSLKTSQFSHSMNSEEQRSDPRTLSQGHHLFLNALHTGLLMGDEGFVSALKELLTLVDHYVALFARLQPVWEGLDLQEDDGVVDAFSNYVQDETDLHKEMLRSRTQLEVQLLALVQRLKGIEKDRLVDALMTGVANFDLERRGFVAWAPRTMDRLIMKLDFLSGMTNRDDEDDGIMSDD